MSSLPGIANGLPVISQTREPKWVRDGSPATQKAYENALAFEDALVEQLSQTLTATSGLTGEGSGSEGAGSEGGEGSGPPGGAGNSELAALLPQGLATSVMNAGGLGLAAQLTQELQGVAGAGKTPASAAGGTQGQALEGSSSSAHAQTAASAGGGVPA